MRRWTVDCVSWEEKVPVLFARRQWIETTLGLLLGSTKLLRARGGLTDRAFAICPPSDSFLATLPRLMELAQLPGLGLGIIQQGTLVWSHYAGMANARRPEVIRSTSLFPAASLGKPVFAYAVLQLVQEGKFALDQPLQQYLNDDTLRDGRAKRITARHVLSHSTGLVNWRSQPGEALAPRFEPGTRFQYSGEGFYLLQRAIEKITGVGFEQFMQDRVFQPLGMNSSTYLWRADADQRLVAGHRGADPFYNRDFATELWHQIQTSPKPFSAWNSELIVQEMAKHNRSGQKPEPNETVPNVAFSLLTTVPDYSMFLGRLLRPHEETFDLQPATRAEMMKPYSQINSALSWGLGWGLEQQAGRRFLWQWGDNGGWKNFVLAEAASRSAIAVFTNGDKGMRIVERVVNAASGQENVAFLWV